MIEIVPSNEPMCLQFPNLSTAHPLAKLGFGSAHRKSRR